MNDMAPAKKPSRWEVFLGWLTLIDRFDRSPEEDIIDYLHEVEARLRRLEASLPRE